ncbi:hypothetical protein FRC20_010884 [Serendipita sp. 405]|nr:hypothetical protein FRC20_010884 [Serendipita sp. 405]
MSFNEMKKSLNRLNTQLKVLGALDDPKPAQSFTPSSPSVVIGLAEDPMVLIHDCERSITKLSRNLCAMAERYSTLVASFTQRGHEPAVPESRPMSPQLPNEIIIEIFKYLVEDGSHHVRSLLFVNKHFNALVTSTPSLWCNIYIQFNKRLEESNHLSARYVQSCLKYSRSTLLNVYLDFPEVPWPSKYVGSRLKSLMDEIPRHSGLIELAIDAIARSDVNEDFESYAFEGSEVDELAKEIIGVEGIHMCRWKMFKLSLPYMGSWIGRAIWDLFEYPTPNLEIMELIGFIITDIAISGIGFPDLAAIRHLTLPPGLLWLMPVPYHLLKTLVVEYTPGGALMSALGNCTSLQELTINRIDGGLPITWNITFPLLKMLSLSGQIWGLENITFETPRLESLKLSDTDVELGLPAVQARSVFCELRQNSTFHSKESYLHHLLTEIKGMEELTIDFGVLEEIIPTVRKMVSKRDAAIVPSLRAIRFVDGEEQLDVIHIPTN